VKNPDTLDISETRKLAGVLTRGATLIHTMPQYASLPPDARRVIQWGMEECVKRLPTSSELTKSNLRFLHSMAFEDAAKNWLKSNPEAISLMKLMQKESAEAPEDLQQEFLRYLSKELEPFLYSAIAEKIFDRLIKSRSDRSLG